MPTRPTILTTATGDYWWPRWSPDGRRLLAGNTSLHVWDRNGWYIDPAPPPVPNSEWRSARWYGEDEILAFAATASGDPVAMFVLPSHLTEPRPVRVEPDAMLVNWIEVINRTDVVGVRASDGALYLNGLRQGHPADRHHGLATDGIFLLTTTENEWLVYYCSTVERSLGLLLRKPRPPESNEYAHIGFTIVYGDLDHVWLHGDRIVDVTVAPWGRERLPILRREPTATWLWTASERPDGTPLILGREVGDNRAIVLEGIAAKALDVALDEDAHVWRIAAYSDHEGHGRPGLVVCSVPVDAPRETLVAPPAPPPPVEQWTPTDDLIDLWSLWIGASGSQYPRRHPDDPGIYWDCQIARLSDQVEHAWFVKVPTGRVYEWRATWIQDDLAWIGLLEDHDEDGRIYRFEDPRLMRRYVRARDVWTWNTRIQEWDHTRHQWGPWTGPGSDRRFRFRVRVASVERSSFGRLRAVIEVDTYQDLEIFELISNKGWSAWEEWTRSEAERGGSPVRTLPEGTRVARTKRVEWPERYDGPRSWPVPPKNAWPLMIKTAPRVTIVEPDTWPQVSTVGPDGLARLRCRYAVTSGDGIPHVVKWVLTSSAGETVVTLNPGTDDDHTFIARPGEYRISLVALDVNGREVDRTGKIRQWLVAERVHENLGTAGRDEAAAHSVTNPK